MSGRRPPGHQPDSRFGGFPGDLGQHADVVVGGDRDGGVAEHLRHHLEVRAAGQRQRRRAVAQVVQPDRRQVSLLEQAGEQPGDAVGHQRGAVLDGEHQPAVGPGRTPLQPLLELADPVQPQDVDGGGVQRDGALAALALGFAGFEVRAELQDLPADGQRRLLQIDLGPAQPDGLAVAQTAEGDDVQQGVVPAPSSPNVTSGPRISQCPSALTPVASSAWTWTTRPRSGTLSTNASAAMKV